MPKRKDAPRREDVPVRIDAGLVRDAKIIAASRDISLAEYLSETLRPTIARDLAQYSTQLEQELARRSKAARPKKNGGD